jgi:aminoglycoside 3-N-acetyltransferase I
MMSTIQIKRLGAEQWELAGQLFGLMAAVFEEENEPLSETYLKQLLSRSDFWAMAALVGDELAGGLTAHTLPLTRREAAELFIYDIAVAETHQRRGIGRLLMTAVQEQARAQGIG